jgi:hypothetical protein
MYRNETNVTFQRNPPRLQRTSSSFSQVFFLIPSERKFLVAHSITADVIWVHHYEPESKAQNVALKRPTSPVAKKLKKVNHQPVRLCLHVLGYGRCDLGSFHSKG